MNKKVEITFIRMSKLNSQILLPGHIIKIDEKLASIYIRQRKAIAGAKKAIIIIRGGREIKIDTELVEGRDKVLARKEAAKKESEHKSLFSKLKEAVNPDQSEDDKDINLAIMSIGELRALAIVEGVLVHPAAKEAGCIKALLKHNPKYKNEAIEGE